MLYAFEYANFNLWEETKGYGFKLSVGFLFVFWMDNMKAVVSTRRISCYQKERATQFGSKYIFISTSARFFFFLYHSYLCYVLSHAGYEYFEYLHMFSEDCNEAYDL